MISNLEPIFTIPNLNTNMRNGKNVNRACQGVENNINPSYPVNKTIKKLPPPSNSSFPTPLSSQALQAPTTTSSEEEAILIPIQKNDFESKFQNILKPVLDLRKKTLFLHSKSWNGTDLKFLLLKNFPKIRKETILTHDNYPNNATKEELQQFLKQPETKIGLFQSRLVTGMEGSNVIYFHDANDVMDTSVRCTMTRAVTNLCIIYQFTNETHQTKFSNMKVNESFMKCQNNFNEYDSKWQCLKCNLSQVCVACSIGCHYGHQTKDEGFIIDKNEKCNCIKSKCLINNKTKTIKSKSRCWLM